MATGFINDGVFLLHDTGAGHPERSARLDSAMTMLERQEWFSKLAQYNPSHISLDWVHQVHARGYPDRIARECADAVEYIDTPDVVVCAESEKAARYAAGSLLTLSDAVMAGEIENGFALVRPPGHHAEHSMAMGFCLYNSVAIAARYLQQHHGLERVLILDWDVHHGNGTQHLFEDDPTVFYISTHQFPFYPGTGAPSETGIGPGKGYTLNCPMSAGAVDADYKEAFERIILPAAKHFNPDIVLLSAGFDAHHADPLAEVNLSTSSFVWMTEMMMEFAASYCDGKIVSVLEGGYDLNALAEGVSAHVGTLSGHRELTFKI